MHSQPCPLSRSITAISSRIQFVCHLSIRQQQGPKTAEVLRTEEKGSDVNLASHLLLDAFLNDCEVAVVISNDSDLRVPIRIAEQQLGVTVGIVNPHPAKNRSRDLRGTFFKQLRPSVLAHCQLPEVMSDQNGTFRKPATW